MARFRRLPTADPDDAGDAHEEGTDALSPEKPTHYSETRHRQRRRMLVLPSTQSLLRACVMLLLFSAYVVTAFVAASNLTTLLLVAVPTAFVFALSNGANDTANSMGTSVGCGILTLPQAIIIGCICEFLGAVSVGGGVTSSISEGVIHADAFPRETAKFTVAMFSVLVGAGGTTLLATIYGLPISATHGIISGLVAVGIAAEGTHALNTESLEMTLVGWVASPLGGLLAAFLVYFVILRLVTESKNPGLASARLQPVFVAVTIATLAINMLVAGPDALHVSPTWLGAAIGCGLGLFFLVATFLSNKCCPTLACCGPAKRLIKRIPYFENVFDYTRTASSAISLEEDWVHLESIDTPMSSRPNQPLISSTTFASSPHPQDSDGLHEEPSCEEPSRTSTSSQVDPSLRMEHVSPEASASTSLDPPGRSSASIGSPIEDSRSNGSQHKKDEGLVDQSDEVNLVSAGTPAEEKPFVPLLILSAMTLAFAHGGNDAANSVAPLQVIYNAHKDEHGNISNSAVDWWVLLIGAVGFVVGIVSLGSRTIETVGSKITALSPSKSFATQMGAAVAVLASSAFALPVSTSHCLVGAVVGCDLAAKMSSCCRGRASKDSLNFSVLRKILIGWVVTIPSSMIVSLAMYKLLIFRYE